MRAERGLGECFQSFTEGCQFVGEQQQIRANVRCSCDQCDAKCMQTFANSVHCLVYEAFLLTWRKLCFLFALVGWLLNFKISQCLFQGVSGQSGGPALKAIDEVTFCNEDIDRKALTEKTNQLIDSLTDGLTFFGQLIDIRGHQTIGTDR